MAIITPEIWAAWANTTLVNPSGDYTSVSMICTQVDRAIKNELKRTLERQTYTIIIDAPTTPTINLQKYAPIDIAGFDCRLNYLANANPAAFTDNTLLQMYIDYILEATTEDTTVSKGNLIRTYNRLWGVQYRYRPWELTPGFTDNYGAVRLSFTAGYDQIPDDITLASCLMITMIRSSRRYGYLVGSESWNGYSYDAPTVGLMIKGYLGDSNIDGLLGPYKNYNAMIG